MSDLLNKASLVMVPSGYKEDTVYSVVPTDGSGDLSFTRASNGTRVNSAGLVEVCPWNLATDSENFSAVYSGINASISNNTTSAPNATTTADSLLETTATDIHAIFTDYTQQSGVQYTYSVYVKSISGRNVRVSGSSGFTGPIALVDLSNGSLLSGSTGASVESVGNGWYRISLTATTTTTTVRVIIYSMNGTATTFAGSTSNGVYLWGAQLNIGSTAKPYFPTTDRLNVPRLTYQNGGGGCPSLLLEKQSTNLCLQSRNFQTTWTNSNVTITANSTTDVYGTTEAQKIEATGSGVHRCAQFLSTTSGSVYALSIDAKKGSTDWVMIRHDNGGSLNYFNLNTGTKGATCDASALIENVGNGWYRLTVFHTTSSSSGPELYVAKGNNDHDFTANGEYIYIDNVQYEQSSYPTSRIITTSSSATRVADECRKSSISSLIGQTEGVLFADVNLTTRQSFTYISISNGGSSANYIGIYFRAAAIEMEVVNGGVLQGNVQYSNTSTGRFKIAIGYKQNDFVLYVNGTQIGTDTSGTIPTCDRLDLFAFNDNQPLQVNETILFPTRLTNAELASLTTI